jgi:hypothetical protein
VSHGYKERWQGGSWQEVYASFSAAAVVAATGGGEEEDYTHRRSAASLGQGGNAGSRHGIAADGQHTHRRSAERESALRLA